MADEDKIRGLRSRLKEEQHLFNEELQKELSDIDSWHIVSTSDKTRSQGLSDEDAVNFVGKNLEGGAFSGENLQGANFSVANLTGVDFSGADLRGVDFSGANLTNADLTGADLTDAVFSGAVLHHTNFSKAKMNGVKLMDADLEDAVLTDIEIDVIGLEELQALIEYLAKYYPHKLNLKKMNLTLLNLATIDLRRVDLRGVDFTGVDFTGVNIAELDLSECIITPQQIAQALGRVPGKEELARILAPKKKKAAAHGGIDFSDFFLGNGREFGIWDVRNDKGVSVESLLNVGKKIFGKGQKPEIKDEASLANVKTEKELQAKSHNEELRRIIEERKQKELASRKAMKENLAKETQSTNDQISEKTAEKSDTREFQKRYTSPVRDSDRGR